MAAPKENNPSVPEGLLEDLKKLFARKPKKKATKTFEKQMLGPGIEVPHEFLVAEQQLIKKLMPLPASGPKSAKGKGVGWDNVLGTHIGQKLSRGKPTGSLCVVVTVKKKLSPSKVDPKYRIPKFVKVGRVQVPVDVKLGYKMKPQAIAGKICGLNKPGIGQGSIGCFCYKIKADGSGRYNFLLTNNHVLGRFVNADPGDDVFEFSSFGSSPGDNIAGTLIKMGGLDDSDGTSIDAAMAYAGLTPDEDLVQHTQLTYSDEIVRAAIDETVMICGARTGHITTGTVRRRHGSYTVPYKAPSFPINREIVLRDVLLILPTSEHPLFSQPGDSGSIVITADGNPTALLIAGGKDSDGREISIAQDLSTIKENLNFDKIMAVS